VGDEVTILYEPEYPSDARIKSFGSSALMWILPGITGILGAAFLGAVIVVQKYLFPSSDAGMQST
jgi:succinate dehydrogenase/fumarate reductase cytochrome b subunit